MVHYYSADYVMPVTSSPIKNGVIAMDENGTVLGIYDNDSVPNNVEIERLKGVLIPGFINAHCHLELSHLSGKISQEQGLVKFITEVMSNRGADDDVVREAMVVADRAMYDSGIQAVGDHVNSAISAPIKEESKIAYHTFVEILGLNDEEANRKIDEAREIEFHFDSAHASITLHAPYSCSKALFKAFKKSVSDDNIISIHNQESEEENKLFRYKTGEFLDFYKQIGFSADDFKAQARNSVQTYMSYLPTGNKIILVHNTFTSLKDLDFIRRMGRDVVMCICPKANLYIEGTLPKVSILEQNGCEIAIGTDSLASNDTLNILDELKTLHKHFPELDFVKTVQWATINGAKALALEESLGSLEVGKTPGLLLVKNMNHFKMTDKVQIERIA
ncbi:Cytosine/adenosine deaminase [Sphingobacterium nematocida]|uniref:Cytosine/adenosine deaminase n=1 Tax=Sphingobacterium nematocida TaxID=1513896 RepID=A0A1T5DNS3_9SPHI|nr:amidohydrolase family protein [Sphingobacterium nematocida]SKB73309.1 Cytosine/adenosine deaminase [Sphingobacterium nematocida]